MPSNEIDISVVIIARNEGRDLEATVAGVCYGDFLPREVVVVDDFSDPPVGDRLDHFPNVRVVRSREQLGVARARNLGVFQTSSERLAVFDSHMILPPQWSALVAGALVEYPQSIICAATRSFNHRYGGASNWTMEGAKLVCSRRMKISAIESKSDDPEPKVVDCPITFGGSYFFNRPTFDQLRGWNPHFFGVGHNEQDLSIRAHLLGIRIRCLRQLILYHRFKQRFSPGYLTQEWCQRYNLVVSRYCTLSESNFERVQPALWPLLGPTPQRQFELRRSEVSSFRDYVQKNRVVADEDLREICNFNLADAIGGS